MSLPRSAGAGIPLHRAWWIDKPCWSEPRRWSIATTEALPPRSRRKLPRARRCLCCSLASQGAPLPLIKAAYRALANLYHPDHGGDGQAVVIINAGYDILCSEHQPVRPTRGNRRGGGTIASNSMMKVDLQIAQIIGYTPSEGVAMPTSTARMRADRRDRERHRRYPAVVQLAPWRVGVRAPREAAPEPWWVAQMIKLGGRLTW